jgi:CheY-like chemotaxis protein
VDSRPKRVLLIDDNALTLQIVSTLLGRSGFEVRTSTTVDVHMPGTSGVELCRQLKATYQTAHVPVVLLSAMSPDELAPLARTCEADGFLTKSNLEALPRELSLLLDSMF